jgi:hypothetical protein
VKHRAVMPEIKTPSEVVEPDIGLHPCDSRPRSAKLGAGALERHLRDVRDRYVGLPSSNQMTG